MWHWLLSTSNDPILLITRLVLGGIIWVHGAQKLLGWFGGYGFTGTMQYFTKSLGIPAPLGLLAIATEFFGGPLLVLGLGGRLMAVGVAAVMSVAALLVHAPNGFFMNWSGGQKGEGFEYHFLAIALAAAIIVHGSGALSIDRLLVH
ncbi:MAG TPA: DoxX family protein [Candidatus Eisenbacteria bacterium]